MKERVEGVQRAFWVLCGAGIVVMLMGMPLGHDAETMRLLAELRGFAAGFDQPRIEAELLGHAREQGRLALADVVGRIEGEDRLEVSADGPALEPRSAVDLGSLGAVHTLSQPGATLDIVVPDPAAIAVALGWRLARRHDDGAGAAWKLVGLALADGGATSAEVAREREVSEARRALRAATQAQASAADEHARAEELVTLRRKWKAHWKAIAKADERRQQTGAELAARTAALDGARKRHEALVRAAGAFAAGAAGGEEGFGVVVARVAPVAGGAAVSLALPVPLERRAVGVPEVRGAELAELRRSALWPALAAGSAGQGIERLEARFSWHYRHLALGPVAIGGTTALQVAPLLFLAVLGMLLQRVRAVRKSYNPFDVPVDMTLPRIGFGPIALNALPVVVLPFVASVACAWSLVQLDQVVVLPVLAAVLSLVLGAWVTIALHGLANLRDAVRRTHSSIPASPT